MRDPSTILYANTSMMSRDPDGVDPDGPGLAGLEPTGVHSMEELMYSMDSPSQEVSEASPRVSESSPRETESIPTPREDQQQVQNDFHLDVAALVGAPPPPPKTPPPKKSKRRSKTPKKESSSDSGFFDDELPVVPTPPEEVPTPQHSSVDHSAHNSLEKQSPETERTLSITEERREKALAMYQSEDLVLDTEEEEEAQLPKQETIRTAMMTLENKPQVVQQRVSPREFHKAAASPRSLRSETTEPRSNQRRQQPVAMENRISYRIEQHQEPPGEDESSDQLIQKQQQQQARRRSVSVDKKEKEKDADIKSGKDNKKRGFFKKLFGKGSGSKDTASDSSRSTKKRSGGTPRDSESVTTPTNKSLSSPRAKQREPSPSARDPSPRSQASTPRALQSSPREKHTFQSSPREIESPKEPQTSDEQEDVWSPHPSDEREAAFRNDLDIHDSKSYDSDLEALEEQLRFGATIAPIAPSPQSEYTPGPVYEDRLPTSFSNVSRLASSPMVINSIRTMDPPDEDGHCDPPVYTGPPLKSPLARNQMKLAVSTSEDEEHEQSRIESVRSRLAGVYEEHLYHDAEEEGGEGPLSGVPNSLSDDRPEVFFAHDELSTLTGPSFESFSRKTRSADPAPAADGIYSEPIGHYFDQRLSTRAHDGGPSHAPGSTNIDPFQTPFFNKEREHGPLPTPAHVARLRVDVPDHPVYDPDGDSPLHTETPAHGRVPHSQYKDPVGESPMAWAKKTHSGYNVPSDESAATRKMGVTFYDPDGNSPSKDAFLVPTPANKVQAGELEEGEADDPPLDLLACYVSDDSTEAEEKKEDELEVVSDALVKEAQKSISVEDTTVESAPASESSAMEAMASPPRDKKNMTKATRAALRLSKATGTAALKAHLDEIPTPTNAETNDSIMGSTPIMSPPSSPKGKDKECKEVGKNIAADLDKVAANADDRSKLHVDTDVSKAGFRSAVSTPVQEDERKSMSVTAAALTNAKAVAYLYRLHGDPSPRHTWHSASKTKRAPSPARNPPSPEAMERKPKKDKTPAKKIRPSPDEYGAHNFDEQQASKPETPKPQPAVDEDKAEEPFEEESMPKTSMTRMKAPTPEGAAANATAKKKRFFGNESGEQAAYKSKFQGRKPRRSAAARADAPPALTSPSTSPSKMKSKTLEKLDIMIFTPSPVKKPATPIGNTISLLAVGKGIELRKKKRINDIASGRAQPVILTPRSRPTGGNRFKFFPAKEEEIKDPIQRAGRRLLSKSAIPIQCAARTFIAKREAVDRMWAIIELQSYFRRWSCEANLQAHSHSATVVQTMARRWLARKQVDDMHHSATQIQKIVRGYLASALVYDTMYYVVLIQSLGRAYNATKRLALQKKNVVSIQAIFRGYKSRRMQELVKVVIPVQAAYRGHKARQDLALQCSFALLIQAAWRSYSARIDFQFKVVDTITVQSIVRRWSACRRVFILNNVQLVDAATKMQATVRGYSARQLKVQIIAARRIQASWRGFQIYTDYIFTVVDVLVVQRSIRQWLAVKKVKAMRLDKAAVAIQSHWRSHRSKMAILYTLVHIIVAQSVARRYLSIIAVQRRRKEMVEVAKKEQYRDHAAMTIQKAWRGFWGFSHYIIVQYEVTRLQALIRGKLARNYYNLRLGCTIIIQATGRQYLAKKAIDRKVVSVALVAASAHELRERNAAKRIQFWWRIVLDWTKEKKAALTIERFFIHVRAEVDREIMNRERQKKAKKEKRRKRKESLNTVDEDKADAFAYPTESGTVVSETSRSQSAPRMRSSSMGISIPGRDGHDQNQGFRHRASSPTMKLVMRHEDNRSRTSAIQRVDSTASSHMRPTDAVSMAPSEDVSEMSAITTPTVFASTPPKYSQRLRPSRSGRTDVTDELSLEEAFHDLENSQSKDNRMATEPSQSKDNRMTTNDYIKKYGLKTAPNRASRNSNHFFGEGNSSSGPHKRQSTGSQLSESRTSQQSTTPRSKPGTPNSQSGAPRMQQVRSPRSHMQKASSPRSHSAPRSQQPSPRGASNGSSHGWQQQVPSPRTPSGGNPPNRYNFHPPANTPPRQKTPRGKDQKYLSARSVSETVDTSASHSQMTPISHASPQSRGVLIMKKSYPSPAYTRSIEESQEVQYLGEEYGEV